MYSEIKSPIQRHIGLFMVVADCGPVEMIDCGWAVTSQIIDNHGAAPAGRRVRKAPCTKGRKTLGNVGALGSIRAANTKTPPVGMFPSDKRGSSDCSATDGVSSQGGRGGGFSSCQCNGLLNGLFTHPKN